MYYKAHSRGLTAYLARELNTDACDPAPTPNDQKIEDLSFLEGQKYESILVRHHRSRFLRELFIRTHGCKCEACEFDFESTYGLSAQGYIEVHHLHPVAMKQRQTPLKGLAALCANCHRVAHLRRPKHRPRTVEELKSLLNAKR